MSTTAGEKIREMREAEGLTRKQFAELTGVPETAQKNYERGITEKIGIDTVMKITNHPRFEKYTLWLMTDKTNEAAGQVSPPLSPDGSGNTFSHQKATKAG